MQRSDDPRWRELTGTLNIAERTFLDWNKALWSCTQRVTPATQYCKDDREIGDGFHPKTEIMRVHSSHPSRLCFWSELSSQN